MRVWLAPFPRAFLGSKGPRARAALTLAIKEINAADAGVTLSKTKDRSAADLQLFLIDAPRGGSISGTGLHWVDGSTLGGATTRLRIEAAKGRIIDGAIAISKDLRITSYESVVLEELTQALGLMTDIDSPAYVGVSIFSQTGNDVKALSIQDKRALRRHYASK
nr:DUF2927 domain-containing protein [Lentibacter algarum]